MSSLMCCVVFMIIICSYHGCSQICPLTGYHNVYHNIHHFPQSPHCVNYLFFQFWQHGDISCSVSIWILAGSHVSAVVLSHSEVNSALYPQFMCYTNATFYILTVWTCVWQDNKVESNATPTPRSMNAANTAAVSSSVTNSAPSDSKTATAKTLKQSTTRTSARLSATGHGSTETGHKPNETVATS